MLPFKRGALIRLGRDPAPGGGVSPATHIASANYNTGGASGSKAIPGTAQALDFAVVMLVEDGGGTVTSPGDGGASWTLIKRTAVGSFNFSTWGRFLTANDISNATFAFGNSDNNVNIGIDIWRGPTVATYKAAGSGSDNGTSTSIVCTGFSPSGSSKGLLLAINEWNYGDPIGNVAATGFTRYMNNLTANTIVSTLFHGTYAGAGYTVTGLSRAAFGFKVVEAIEFT